MTDPLLVIPSGGWTVDNLDGFPESHHRYELTDGALTVSPSPSSLHQAVAMRLGVRLEAAAPEPLAVTQAVEIRFGRQLTRIPDVLVVRSEQPGRHWFAPSEVLVAVEIESPGSHLEDRATKPALYARHRIPDYWRFEIESPLVSTHGMGHGDSYRITGSSPRLTVIEPFAVDIAVADLLPHWRVTARDQPCPSWAFRRANWVRGQSRAPPRRPSETDGSPTRHTPSVAKVMVSLPDECWSGWMQRCGGARRAGARC